MTEITLEELNTLYNDTINKCGSYLLDADDETIEYLIFEEFDIGVVTFLHISNLKKLFKSGFISEEKMNKSLLLRGMVLELQDSNEWNLDAFKKSTKWKKLLKLADEIKHLST